MGCFDTFIDGKKEVQLKNFGSFLCDYEIGAAIPMKKFGYPKDGLFFCFVNPDAVVLIEDSMFKGIITHDKALNVYTHRIWDCGGNEFTRKEGKKK